MKYTNEQYEELNNKWEKLVGEFIASKESGNEKEYEESFLRLYDLVWNNSIGYFLNRNKYFKKRFEETDAVKKKSMWYDKWEKDDARHVMALRVIFRAISHPDSSKDEKAWTFWLMSRLRSAYFASDRIEEKRDGYKRFFYSINDELYKIKDRNEILRHLTYSKQEINLNFRMDKIYNQMKRDSFLVKTNVRLLVYFILVFGRAMGLEVQTDQIKDNIVNYLCRCFLIETGDKGAIKKWKSRQGEGEN